MVLVWLAVVESVLGLGLELLVERVLLLWRLCFCGSFWKVVIGIRGRSSC